MTLVRATLPIGIVVRKAPGVTRWAAWSWKVVAVIPGAGPAKWKELRRDGDAVEYRAATLPLDLWSTDTEAYLAALSSRTPGLVVVLREALDGDSDLPWTPTFVTASPSPCHDHPPRINRRFGAIPPQEFSLAMGG